MRENAHVGKTLRPALHHCKWARLQGTAANCSGRARRFVCSHVASTVKVRGLFECSRCQDHREGVHSLGRSELRGQAPPPARSVRELGARFLCMCNGIRQACSCLLARAGKCVSETKAVRHWKHRGLSPAWQRWCEFVAQRKRIKGKTKNVSVCCYVDVGAARV